MKETGFVKRNLPLLKKQWITWSRSNRKVFSEMDHFPTDPLMTDIDKVLMYFMPETNNQVKSYYYHGGKSFASLYSSRYIKEIDHGLAEILKELKVEWEKEEK